MYDVELNIPIMKRIFILLLSILVLAACDIDINITKDPDNTDNSENLESGSPSDPSDPSDETPLDRELICGTWKIIRAKYSEDAQLTEWEHEDTYAIFKENGIYKGEGYWGNGEGTYFVSGRNITAYINNEPFIKYEVLDITESGDEEDLDLYAEIKITIVSSEQNVWVTCKKVEELDTNPEDSFVSDNLYDTENGVKMAVASVYGYMRDFELYQHFIEYNAINNQRTQLSVSSSLIEKTWEAAYKTINSANAVIKGLSTTTNQQEWISYDCHARVIRAFVYYNLITLWGDVPYMTENNYNDVTALMAGVPRTNAMTILADEVVSVTQSMNELKDLASGSNDFSKDAINLLLAEIDLYRNESVSAKAHLNSIDKYAYTGIPIFSISLTDINAGYSSPSFYNQYKGLIWEEHAEHVEIYNASTIDLYMKEAENETSSIPAEWSSQPQYGYWAMLNRLGKAQEVTGCEPHETLMPIPESEMRNNRQMIQNSGY